MAHGAQWTYLVCSGFGVAALVAALFLPRKVAAESVPVATH
jgi:DHA2 family lincomycin resistance protein-like MFS transporter